MEAYRKDAGPSAIEVRVVAFTKDSTGVLVRLSPLNEDVLGGGTLVRVTADGRARIVERYQ